MAQGTVSPPRYVLTFDADACRWCRACELACSLCHEGMFQPTASRIRMILDPFEAEMKAEICRQCRKPFCMLACPQGAIVRDDRTGAYLVMSEMCDGCGACAEACPFNRDGMVLRFDESRGVFVKCDLCGGTPECVAVCPTGALKYIQVGRANS